MKARCPLCNGIFDTDELIVDTEEIDEFAQADEENEEYKLIKVGSQL